MNLDDAVDFKLTHETLGLIIVIEDVFISNCEYE